LHEHRSGNNSSAKSTAQDWLDAIRLDTEDRLTQSYDPVVLTKDGKQDQIGIIAPCPPALYLTLAGLLPLAAYGWRRRQVLSLRR
jgi:hypothetical protein